MKKQLLFVLLFYCFQFEKGDDDLLKKGKMDRDFVIATDPYGTPTTLLYEGETLNFRCAESANEPTEEEIETFDASTIFFRGSTSPEEVAESLTLNLNSTKFGWYTCGSLSEIDTDHGFNLEYLLCDDTSDTCQNMECENPKSHSYCVIRPDDHAPSKCKIINQGHHCFNFGKSAYGYACDKEDKHATIHLCSSLYYADNVAFLTKDDAYCDDDRVNLVTKTANDKRMYLGEVARLGSSLIVTCKEESCDSNYINGEEHHITKSQKLTYDPESKSFNLPNESYSAVTKIIVKREDMEDNIQTYVYNVRLDASVNLKRDGEIISCSFKYPPEPEQKKMFKLHLILKLNESVIIESDAEQITTNISIGNYSCESEMFVKKCNPFYTTSDNKIETLQVNTASGRDFGYRFSLIFIIAAFVFC